MKIILLWSVMLCSGCAAVPAHEELPVPKGQLLASITMTASAHQGRTKRDARYLFYTDSPSNAKDRLLTGYEIVDAKIKDVFGGASDSANVTRAIAAVGLEPFDLQNEVKDTTVRLSKPGKPFLGPVCVVGDGADYEIMIATERGEFSLREHEPGCTIEAYAQFSPNIGKLKAVLDLLAQYYGRTKFGT